MTNFSVIACLLSTALACASASAETLNFESLGSVELTPATLDLDGTLIQGARTSLFIIASDPSPGLNLLPGEGGAICSAFRPKPDTLRCSADMQISFKTTVSNLNLQTFGYDPGDKVTIVALDINGTELGRQIVDQGDAVVDFTALSGVKKLDFSEESSGSGFAFGKFSFTSSASPVPEPSTGLLMLLGVAALGQFARRRQAS